MSRVHDFSWSFGVFTTGVRHFVFTPYDDFFRVELTSIDRHVQQVGIESISSPGCNSHPPEFFLGSGWMLCWWVRPSCRSRCSAGGSIAGYPKMVVGLCLMENPNLRWIPWYYGVYLYDSGNIRKHPDHQCLDEKTWPKGDLKPWDRKGVPTFETPNPMYWQHIPRRLWFIYTNWVLNDERRNPQEIGHLI